MPAIRAAVADDSYSKTVLAKIGFKPVEEKLQQKLMRQFKNFVYEENSIYSDNTVHMEISREADRMAL